jgi:uncharacterized protein YbjQ (UPF0145 family)
MKVKEIAKTYGIDEYELEQYLWRQSDVKYKDGFNSTVIDDGDVNTLVTNFKREPEILATKKAEEAEMLAKEKAEEAERFARENPEEAERLANIEAEKIRKQTHFANMLITSGFNFDGYTITKYSGYISGDDVIEMARGTSFLGSTGKSAGSMLTDSLVQLRRNALIELKEAAHALGCNAVIGVDFDYITLEPETASITGHTTYLPYVFCVTANGNAVIIEKNKTIG